MRGLPLLLAALALQLAAAQPQFEIFEPLAGAEYAKDQEITLSFQGTGFPKNDKRAELLLNKRKLRDLPLPANDGDVFNVTLTGVKKGRHEFDVVLYYGDDPAKEEVLDVWGSFFFVGAETARLTTKLKEQKKKAGSKEWAADTLMTWMTSKGADVEKISIKEDKIRGLGIFTNQAVKGGEILAEIPFAATLGPESASKNMYSEFLLTLYSDKEFPAQFANAVHLICELQQDGAYMSKVLDNLPPHNDESLNLAISWDRHDHMRAVRLVPIFTKPVHDQQEFFDRGYERFWTMLDMYEKQFKKLKKAKQMPKLSLFTRGNMIWAMSVVLSRSWRCPNSPDVVADGYAHRPGLYRLVPPTDTINFLPYSHLPYPPVARESFGHVVILVNNTDAKVRMHAAHNIPEGAQVFLNVGELTNHELMVQYGFIVKPNMLDFELFYPSWVTGAWITGEEAEAVGKGTASKNLDSIRMAWIAPGAAPAAFAKELNVSVPDSIYSDEGKMDALRAAMDELFEATIVLVPHDAEGEKKVCTEKTAEACAAAAATASQLVKNAEFTARSMMTYLGEDVNEEVKAAWDNIKKVLGV